METKLARYTRHTRLAAIVSAFVLLALVAGCGGTMSAPGRPPVAPQRAMVETPAAYDEAAAADAVVANAAAEGEFVGAASAPIDTRKIIATAHMEIVVEDTEASAAGITALAGENGGYVSQANLYQDSWGDANLLRGTLTLRVPADRLEPFMAQLEELALEVRAMSLDRQDVTDQYSDIEAQLRNLEATENELRELLAEVRSKPNAKSEDILAVHRDLTEIRGEIERLQGRQNLLDDQIALSTLTVTLIPDEASRPVVEERWEPSAVVRDAARALVSALQFFGNLAIWVLVFLLPILLLAMIPLALIVWLVRTIVLRRQRRRQSEESEEQA